MGQRPVAWRVTASRNLDGRSSRASLGAFAGARGVRQRQETRTRSVCLPACQALTSTAGVSGLTFSDSVKLEAKERSQFCCVVCHQPWVEVHHIIPQTHGGPDTLENAAPLCASCHQRYGGNPDLRKQLREMRDWGWE